jgi:molybdopterin-binding protein
LGIEHLRDRPASKLSGGEAQRTSLARAFALEPEIILLDEPFSALDAPTRARLLEDFQSLLSTTNITAIFITHDLDEALLLGDRVAVLLNGRIRQIGPPDRVFTEPADPDVASFVGVEMVIPARVISSKDGHVFVEARGQQLEAVGDFDAGREVYFCLRPEDITLFEQEGRIPSSARNRITGRIIRLSPQGPLFQVTMDAGIRLVALLTRASVEDMNLEEGRMVTAAFKASAVHLIPR